MRGRPVTAAPAARSQASRRTAERRPLPDVRHIVMPFAVTATATPEQGETIGAFLERNGWASRLYYDATGDRQISKRWHFKLPTICVVNGQPVLQRYWKRRRIKATDRIEFWSRPWGGGTGKQIAGIVALVALAAFAPWAAGAIGLTGLAASAFVGAVTIGGGLLVAALTRPNPGGQNATDGTNDQVEQLYSVAAQGNTARLMQPLTAQYGRVKSFPDFAITPWSEFDGNDQYLNVLLAVSLGKVVYEAAYIDDTILWTQASGYSPTFEGVQIASYDPGQPVTLFPVNVVQSSEVAGQELSESYVGGFVANASGTTANALAVDLVWPSGMFQVNEETGELAAQGVGVHVEVRTVDGAGAPIGDWEVYASVPYQFATRNPQRRTIKFTVPAARYEVRVRRDTPAANGGVSGDNGSTTQNSKNTVIDTVAWAGLRAFIDGPASFPVSTLAIRIKANSQLTQTSARKFGVLCTRKLNVWDTGTSTFVEQATRNPFWAAWDAATDTDYGAGRPPSKVDFQTLFDLATAADARGDTFDHRFSAAVAVPEALDTILRVARARHRWSGDVLTFVRDEWSDVPRMLLTDREIMRDSLSIDYALNPDDASDAVIVEYLDEDIWNFAEVQYPENSLEFTALNPTRIRLPGIVSREHAHREAGFYYLQSQLRRVNVKLDTEHDGRMLGFGSRVRVQTELPTSWGASGVVVSRSTNNLVVSPAPTWTVGGTHYIAIRTKTGRQFGPVLCTQGATTADIVLNPTDLAAVEAAQSRTLADALDRADGADEPSFDFGAGTSRARDCIVLTGRPSGDRVTLGLVVDKEAVHATDLGDVPVRPSLPTLADARTPVIVGLYATFRQNVAEPILDASWIPAAGAQYYNARVSYDSGASWTVLPETVAPQLSTVVDRAALRLQVQGVGVRRGAWTSVDLDAPVIRIAPGTVDIQSLISGLSDRVNNTLKAAQERIAELTQFVASYSTEQEAHNALDKVKQKRREGVLREIINDSVGDLEGIGARMTLAEGAIVDANEAFAAFFLDLTTNYATSTSAANARSYTVTTATSTANAAVATLQTEISTNYTTSSITANARAHTTSVATSTASAAVSSYDAGVSSTFGGLTATVTGSFNAVSTINGNLAASYAVTLDVNGYASGFKLLSNGTTSTAAWAVDTFTIGTSGHASVPVFQVGTVGGVAAITIRGSLQADGTILARHIVAGAVTTDKVDARAINTGKIAINGVDLENILDEAVSTKTAVNFGAFSNGGANGILLASGSLTIKSGRTVDLVIFSPQMNASTGGPTDPPTMSFEIRVDGVTHYTAVMNLPAFAPSNNSYQRIEQLNLTVPLGTFAVGSHSFAVYHNGSGIAQCNIAAGRVTIEQIHR